VAHDEDMATSVPGVFVAGEASGIGGADLAQAEGELAGVMAAAHVAQGAPAAATSDGARPRAAVSSDGAAPRAAAPPGRAPRAADVAALRARRAKLAGFAGVLSDLFDPRPGLLGLATPTTVLCRCEDITAGAIDDAVARGADTMSALKIVTRCGQGPCQGRVCERLVCERLDEPERFSARAPIRPIPLGVLMEVE